MSEPLLACIGLGANLGDRRATLVSAVRSLAASAGIEVLACARAYDTAPIGPDQPRYLNSAVRVRASCSPHALLDLVLEIERAHGRDRSREIRFGPRTLDLDVLYIVGVEIDTGRLHVPHARLVERAFALVPMLEVMPEARPLYASFLQTLPALGPGELLDID